MGKLYVGNIPWSATEEQLTSFFSKIGSVSAVRIVTDKITKKSKGFAFIEMENSEKAIIELNGSDMGGRPIRVSEARERTDNRGPRSYN